MASLVCGIAGLATLCFCPVASPVLGVVAIVQGTRAQHAIRASAGLETGEGLATGGVVTGWVAVGMSIVLLLAIVAVLTLGVVSSQQHMFVNTVCTGNGC